MFGELNMLVALAQLKCSISRTGKAATFSGKRNQVCVGMRHTFCRGSKSVPLIKIDFLTLSAINGHCSERNDGRRKCRVFREMIRAAFPSVSQPQPVLWNTYVGVLFVLCCMYKFDDISWMSYRPLPGAIAEGSCEWPSVDKWFGLLQLGAFIFLVARMFPFTEEILNPAF